MSTSTPVMLFDGACGLCTRGARFVARHTHPARPLDLRPLTEDVDDLSPIPPRLAAMDSMHLWDGRRWHARSAAAIRANRHLRHPWRLGLAALVIPAPLRDLVHRMVARSRRHSGAPVTCDLHRPHASAAEARQEHAQGGT